MAQVSLANYLKSNYLNSDVIYLKKKVVLNMRMIDIIEKKRDGHELTTEEIQFFINGYTSGDVPDYQASAHGDGNLISAI